MIKMKKKRFIKKIKNFIFKEKKRKKEGRLIIFIIKTKTKKIKES